MEARERENEKKESAILIQMVIFFFRPFGFF